MGLAQDRQATLNTEWITSIKQGSDCIDEKRQYYKIAIKTPTFKRL